MLVARTPLAPAATVQAVLSQITSGMTFAVVVNVAALGVPGTGSTFSNDQGSAGPAIDRAIGPRARWRASKGLAPVNRFTRSFGDNATEGWHRSMPVGIEVTAGTTATVAAMFVLGASSTAEARATAATIGAFVLGVAAIAQATATASGTGRLTAGVTSVAQARATAGGTGTLTLGVTAIAQSLARANAVGTFVLQLTATAAGTVPVVLGPGLILGDLTWVARLAGPLTHVSRLEGALTCRARLAGDVTHTTRHDGPLTFRTH